MSTINRTWPYGTRKTGEVYLSQKVRLPEGKPGSCVAICDDNDLEAYILVQAESEPMPAAGSIITIEFVEGGPRGGHWRIVNA